MAWTREEFEARVRQLEPEAERDPGGYRLKVAGMVMLGYGFILLLLLGALAGLGGLIVLFATGRGINFLTLKLAFVLGVFVLATGASLWVRFPRPDGGIPLQHADAPRLFERVQLLADKLQAPRPHHILLISDMNAAVIQRPRLGIFGWSENYLLVGLPLLLALSPAQFESVIAHELGHLRGGHGRFGAWIYRVQESWTRLAENHGGSLIDRFFWWYAPRFNAYTFPLRRQEEYEADRVAATVASPRIAADALCALPVIDDTLDRKVWKPIGDAVRKSEKPPASLFVPMRDALGRIETTDRVESEKILQIALCQETDFHNTHPALRDRLAALGQTARLPEVPETSAAVHFLGASLPRLSEVMDAMWLKNIGDRWETAHKELSEQNIRFNELDARVRDGAEITANERWEYANLVEEHRGEMDAVPLYRALFDEPDVNLGAMYAVGRILLEKDDAEGVGLLEEVARREVEATNAVNGLLHDYYQRNGQTDTANEVRRRAMRHADKLDEAAAERQDAKGRYIPHGLPPETVDKVRELVVAIPGMWEAYLVRKDVLHFADTHPVYVIGFRLHIRPLADPDGKYAEATGKLADALGESGIFKDTCFAQPLYGNMSNSLKLIQRIEGSLLVRVDGKGNVVA